MSGSSRIPLGDVDLWFEERGAGPTVLMMHGGFSDSRDFDDNLAALGSEYRLLLLDRRGHGRTADVEGPLTLEVMADDSIRFIEAVVGGPVAVVGYSAGAAVALRVAARRAELVTALVLFSGWFDADGLLVRPAATADWPAEIVHAYGEVSPDGIDHFPAVAAKIAAAARDEEPLTASELGRITCPALVAAADDDLVALEHTIELYRALPDGHLAVLPGATHLLLHEHPEECARLAADFLAGRRGLRRMPISRSAEAGRDS
ncbi:alpha/beta hydrolase [Microbacterium sp. ProA8]|uniref:alpha/beta fold hydrolase n=1 Tax=Microbacterium chionoecetis TaxID=3153754 RepID=UPI00326544D7